MFEDCSNLDTIYLPGSLNEIGFYAFTGCDKLKTVYYYGTESTWNEINIGSGNDALLQANIIYLAAPVIISSPKSAKVVSGKTVDFTVTASGEGLKYQWYVQKKGTTYWSEVNGGTSAKLTVTATAAMDGNKYRCVVTNGTGDTPSQAAKLSVVTKPTITTQPKKASVKAGKKVTFKVKASGYDLKYQWYYQKPNTKKWVKISKATKASYSFKAGKSKNGYKYRCYITNAAGTTKSKAVKLTVK